MTVGIIGRSMMVVGMNVILNPCGDGDAEMKVKITIACLDMEGGLKGGLRIPRSWVEDNEGIGNS